MELMYSDASPRYQRARQASKQRFSGLPGGHSEREPPDPIPNSEVKTPCADGSVAASHARVGHCQAPHAKNPDARKSVGVLSFVHLSRNTLSGRTTSCPNDSPRCSSPRSSPSPHAPKAIPTEVLETLR